MNLSTDAAVRAQQLLARNNPQIADDIETLVAIVDRLRLQPMPPAVIAAMYRVLGGFPAVEDAGVVTDRGGRTGIAVAVDSAYSGLPTRHLLIIDPATGAPLASEEILTTDAGKLNVPIPSAIGYTAYMGGGTVPTVGARP